MKLLCTIAAAMATRQFVNRGWLCALRAQGRASLALLCARYQIFNEVVCRVLGII
jgi:hypothetical protein